MSPFLYVLLITSVGASAAPSNTELSSLRDSASRARQRVSELRGLEGALRKELGLLAPRIEVMKEQQGLMPDKELKAELRRSQELSERLTELAQSLAAAESDAQRKNLALIDALSAELRRLQTDWDRTENHEQREQLLVKIRSLRAERDELRAAIPLRGVPAITTSRPSDEPEALHEQVDALRDAEDKVQQQLQSVDTRIAEVRDELELDRRMRDFVSEQSLFDDQDRRFRFPREARGSFDTARGNPTGEAGPTGGSTGNPTTGPPSTLNPGAERAAEKPPQVDDARKMSALSEGNNLESLEALRDNLRALAKQLHEKAQQVEAEARAREQR